VGGKTQLPAYRAVAGHLRLSYSQFEELETFARFGTRLDETTLHTLEHGRRIREVLKQSQYEPLSASEQIAVLLAAAEGLFDAIPPEEVAPASNRIRKAVSARLPEVCAAIESGAKLSDEDRDRLLAEARNAVGEKDEKHEEAS
jgi:F-type H+-transporting ATPase subunit alpha